MKSRQKVFIKTGSISDDETINFIIAFALETVGWEFPEEQSDRYAIAAATPACKVVLTGSSPSVSSTVAVMKKKDGIFYVPDIIPIADDCLTVTQYNAIAVTFGVSLRRYFKKHQVPVSVSLPSSEFRIENIIRSKKARNYFDKYLQQYPYSFHPSDIERLDKFICALVRYSRGIMDFDAFEQYLIEELGWQHKYAKRCRERVEIGWDILLINKDF